MRPFIGWIKHGRLERSTRLSSQNNMYATVTTASTFEQTLLSLCYSVVSGHSLAITVCVVWIFWQRRIRFKGIGIVAGRILLSK